MATGRDNLRKVNKQVNGEKKIRFLTIKMWISFLISLTTRDRGTIPENIGNNILIMNNMYITKNFLSSLIQLVELSLDTPITLLNEMIINELRNNDSKAVVDFTIKNTKKNVNLGDSGLRSRIDMWERSETNKYISAKDKKRAVRLLYTVDQVKQGQPLLESRIFITIRASTGTELSSAETIIYKYLSKIGCVFKPINSSLNEYLEYVSLLSNKTSKIVKSMPTVINSNKTLSQLLPNTHSPGSPNGIVIGTNTINNVLFKVDFKKISIARNIYIIGNTGGGKTAMILNMCASALEEGYNLCMMDIKGNEFKTIVDSVGGATISLRETSQEYINTFVMLKEETNTKGAVQYYKNRLNFSKKQMIILSGVSGDNNIMQLEGFLDEFFEYLYTAIGVRSDNINTWKNTLILNPYVVYEYIEKYLNEPVKVKYRDVLIYITTNLRMYFSRDGSKSYIFNKELQYKDLLTRRAIRFDFGMFSESSYDNTVFKLKFEYMVRINSEYVGRNFNNGIHTFKVLEEAQAVGDDIMESYAKEYTMRRSSLQTTVLSGNSVDALVRNPKAMPIIETTTSMLIGKLNKATADLIIKYFDVGSKEGVIRHMSANNQYMRHFLFINNMEPKALTPILKVNYEPGVTYSMLTPTKDDRAY